MHALPERSGTQPLTWPFTKLRSEPGERPLPLFASLRCWLNGVGKVGIGEHAWAPPAVGSAGPGDRGPQLVIN